MIHETNQPPRDYDHPFPTGLPLGFPDSPDFMAPQKLPLSDPNWWSNFQQLLDDNNDWPVTYVFKFIVPKKGMDELQQVFEGNEVDIKASKKGNYQSLTTRIRVESSDEVVAIYRAAGEVEGVIAL